MREDTDSRRRDRTTMGFGMRAITIATRRMRASDRAAVVDDVGPRPRTRGDCLPGGTNAARPCPWVTCRHHLYLDVNPESGAVKLNFPDREPWDLVETCALDVAGNIDDGGNTLDVVGRFLNVTRERVRQLEVDALKAVRRRGLHLGSDQPVVTVPATNRRAAINTDKAERAARAVAANPFDTDREIARALGVTVNTVARQRKRLGIAPSRQDRRATMKGSP